MTSFRLIEGILDKAKVDELKGLASSAHFVDGRISNPHSKVKDNLHLHDQEAYQKTSQIMAQALIGNEEFRDFAFPHQIAPPLMTKYQPGMKYGAHADAALMQIGNAMLRSDLSCTLFLNDPASYEGGALRIELGDGELRFKGPPGSAIVYPSTTTHEVEPVTSGERLVGLTFIQSQIRDTAKRTLLYELGEVAALEGNNMSYENYSRLRGVQQNLQRRWSDV